MAQRFTRTFRMYSPDHHGIVDVTVACDVDLDPVLIELASKAIRRKSQTAAAVNNRIRVKILGAQEINQ